MRPLALIPLLLLAFGGILHAQDLSPKWNNIINPDQTVRNSLQDKTYYSGGSGGMDLKQADVNDFYFVQKFSAKTYETKEYASRDFWGGDFQFATKGANVKTYASVDKIFDTKSAPVKASTESDKNYAVQGYATRAADEKGKTSQMHLDEIYKGKGQMNMDQIRDLLNKSN